MTREEYQEEEIKKSGMERGHFLETFRIYPCWCGQEGCPGWQTWTDREIQIVLASSGHLIFPEESRR